MIQVPCTWKCASATCVCVEVGSSWWICHVCAVPYATTRYCLNPLVHIPAARAALFVRDNTSFTEVKYIRWHAGHAPAQLQFSSVPEAADGAEKMSLHCLDPVYYASAVTVGGVCSGSTRATMGFLSATLAGRFICVGASVDTALGTFTVQDVTLRDGYRGVALISADSRVRLNPPKETGTVASRAAGVACPVGLEAPVRQLMQFVAFADSHPGHVSGVVVRGPSGCGVQTTVDHCLSQCVASGATVYHWSPQAVLEAAVPARLSVVLVSEASRYFSNEEPDMAKLCVRQLASDASRLSSARNGLHPSVVVIAVSHDYGTLGAKSVMDGFFSTHVVISPPDAAQRAVLLASRRGGHPSDWTQEAQTLVGKTRRDVLVAAETSSWKYTPPFKSVRWDEIGGITDVKERLYRALVWPQRHPEELRRFGITSPKGILLYGPPGCAKTTLVKALCSEGQFSFIYLDSASVLSAFVGDSEQHVRDVFARAAQQAPCIVFFDEVEVIGGRRGTGQHDAEQTRLLSTLLTEMDGFTAARGVCFIGATNVPDMIDDALLRPGRFDYLVYVPLPTLSDRQSILTLHLSETAANVDSVAHATEGFSGADLASLCASALLRLLRSELSAPDTLHDEAFMTAYLLDHAAAFPRTEYDMSRITDFHQSHSTH